MVHLTRIYTRTGDQGTTRLANNDLVAKTDLRLEAYGCVDEANSAIGVAGCFVTGDSPMAMVLAAIQNDLFDLGADLSTPVDPSSVKPTMRVSPVWIERLERWCDEFGADLPALPSFVLPSGSPGGTSLNLARTIVRRAERACWRAESVHSINPLVMTYLNRLSDLLFIMGRQANLDAGCDEALWDPATSGRS